MITPDSRMGISLSIVEALKGAGCGYDGAMCDVCTGTVLLG